MTPLRVRWLGRVRYREALDLQHAMRDACTADYLLLLEHPHVYTLGVRTKPEHLLAGVAASGADVVRADRGGDVTYHGPGQLVGYPVVDVSMGHGAVPAYVHAIEQLVIDVLADLGLGDAGRLDGYPGVWVDPAGVAPRKICAIGVRVDRGRSMHGFALNVEPDLAMFDNIVPCGITDKAVTSLAREGIGVSMRDVVEAVCLRAAAAFSFGPGERAVELQTAAWRVPLLNGGSATTPNVSSVEIRSLDRRLSAAGVDPAGGIAFRSRKPSYLRAPVKLGPEVLQVRSMMRGLNLVTVCEEAGCPNLSECWADGTATFMINGERCTRACGFCLVDTRHPLPLDADEAAHVADAVVRMGLAHAVVTAVARDDLDDGGAAAFAATVQSIRRAPHPRLQGGCRCPRRNLRHPSRRPEPQHRDSAPPATGCAPLGFVREEPHRIGPRQGCRSRDEVRPHPRHGRNPPRDSRHPLRPPGRRRGHRDDRSILAPERGASSGAALVAARGVRGDR
jgi:lipoic acid synthetase